MSSSMLILYSARGTPIDDRRIDYFPEFFLAKWFREHEKQELTVYTFDKTGTDELIKNAYFSNVFVLF